MTSYELIDILHSIGSRLDVQWGFFISIHMALLGGLMYVDRPLRFREKASALVVYSGFAYLNYTISMMQSHQLLAAYKQLEKMAAEAGADAQAMLAFYGAEKFTESWETYETTAFSVHVFMAVVVVASILLDKAPKA